MSKEERHRNRMLASQRKREEVKRFKRDQKEKLKKEMDQPGMLHQSTLTKLLGEETGLHRATWETTGVRGFNIPHGSFEVKTWFPGDDYHVQPIGNWNTKTEVIQEKQSKIKRVLDETGLKYKLEGPEGVESFVVFRDQRESRWGKK